MEIGNFSVPPQWVGVAGLPYSKTGETENVFFGYLGHDLLACYVGIIDCGALKLFLRFDSVIDAARRNRGGRSMIRLTAGLIPLVCALPVAPIGARNTNQESFTARWN